MTLFLCKNVKVDGKNKERNRRSSDGSIDDENKNKKKLKFTCVSENEQSHFITFQSKDPIMQQHNEDQSRCL